MSSDKIEKITGQLITLLNDGSIPWRKPFDVDTRPVNGSTGSHYDGFNAWILHILPYDEPYYMGFKQAQKMGGHVKKGEKGWVIMFPFFNHYDNETGDRISACQAKTFEARHGSERVHTSVGYGYSHVWNIEQCEGIDREQLPAISPRPELDFSPIEKCEQIWEQWSKRPPLQHKGGQASHNRLEDKIIMPEQKYFDSAESYYATLFHEAIHASGSPDRLGREKGNVYGDEQYSLEELTAELGSAFLCGKAGIEKPLLKNKAAYIQGWLNAFEEGDNTDWILKAYSQAREAYNYITGESQAGKDTLKETGS